MSLISKLGGRKACAFYVTLGVITTLTALNKATTEVLGVIDGLYLIYAGANVSSKKKAGDSNGEKQRRKSNLCG